MNVLPNGIAVGFFININIYDGIQGDFDDKVLTDQLYIHEYGYYRQSLDYGLDVYKRQILHFTLLPGKNY